MYSSTIGDKFPTNRRGHRSRQSIQKQVSTSNIEEVDAIADDSSSESDDESETDEQSSQTLSSAIVAQSIFDEPIYENNWVKILNPKSKFHNLFAQLKNKYS